MINYDKVKREKMALDYLHDVIKFLLTRYQYFVVNIMVIGNTIILLHP